MMSEIPAGGKARAKETLATLVAIATLLGSIAAVVNVVLQNRSHDEPPSPQSSEDDGRSTTRDSDTASCAVANIRIPQIKLSNDSGSPEMSVTVTGIYFYPEETVDISFGYFYLDSKSSVLSENLRADKCGEFSFKMRIPEPWNGPNPAFVFASGRTTRLPAYHQFTIVL